MMKPIRIGLIGLGRAGNGMHRSELRSRGDKFQFAAVCDCIEERTAGFVEEFGSRPYTKIEDLLADPEVELVTIATRSADHYKHAKMALEAGKYNSISLLTGPEGGLEEKEVAQALEAGLQVCTLGRRILRCETAPLCALSAVMYASGEF